MTVQRARVHQLTNQPGTWRITDFRAGDALLFTMYYFLRRFKCSIGRSIPVFSLGPRVMLPVQYALLLGGGGSKK